VQNASMVCLYFCFMKKQTPTPEGKPITNNTIIEGCYEMQKFIVEKAKAEERGISRNELKIILGLTRCIKGLGNGDKSPDTERVIIIGPKDRDF
jgi:hypothetical protein